MHIGFFNNPKKPQKDMPSMCPSFQAMYLLGHPSMVGTNILVKIVLWNNKITVYSAFRKGVILGPTENFVGTQTPEDIEQYKLFDLPYEKVGPIGGDGSHLIITAIGHDKDGGKRYVPIEFTIFSQWNVPDKTSCIRIKSALDREINKRNQITI
jgi:hypothetical protein